MPDIIDQRISRNRLTEFCRRNGIKKLSLFGTCLKGAMQPGRKVDLRTPQELSRYFRDEVLRMAKVDYEA